MVSPLLTLTLGVIVGALGFLVAYDPSGYRTFGYGDATGHYLTLKLLKNMDCCDPQVVKDHASNGVLIENMYHDDSRALHVYRKAALDYDRLKKRVGFFNREK
jgi:hypothetical protein